MTDDPSPHTSSAADRPPVPEGKETGSARSAGNPGTKEAGPKDDRAERLARALRDNLRRRKEQERARGDS
ncbi:hypothetical protein [Rhodocista pekingensis]|uniref:Uncharacterized protein n=1 Tax=Rhodocista pekingensis TaxID=201185 RepID=A0ABW2KVB5_9PROT